MFEFVYSICMVSRNAVMLVMLVVMLLVLLQTGAYTVDGSESRQSQAPKQAHERRSCNFKIPVFEGGVD